MGKFKVKYVIITLLIVGALGGVGYSYYAKKQAEKVVNVVSIQELNSTYFMDEEVTYNGTPKKGSILNIKVDTDFEIEDVKVAKGDTVKKGDVLFTYNTHSLELSIEEYENNLHIADNNITVAQNELSVLRRLQPLENAPEEYDEPDDEETEDQPISNPGFDYSKKINKDTKPISGSGTAEDPFTYIAGIDTVVTKDYLTDFADKKDSYTLLYVCSNDGNVLFGRLIESNKIEKDKVTDWLCTDGVTLDPMGGISFDQNNTSFAKVIVYPQPINVLNINQPMLPDDMDIGMPEDYFEQADDNTNDISENIHYEISDDDNYKFPLETLKQMIKEKEDSIENLKLRKKQTEIDCRKAKKRLETGSELSTMDGTVTFVAKDIRHLSESGAFITIVSSTGMSITCSIGEFSLDKISLNMPVAIQNYENGMTYSGRITEISDKPMVFDDSSSENTTQSSYEFIVTSNDEFSLSDESSVSVKLMNKDSDNQTTVEKYNIELAFVREENGRYIAMVEGKDGLLEKRVLTVGATHMGISLDVIGGLESNDYLAIPYGRAVEGMPTKRVSLQEMYGTGMLGLF